MIIKNIFLSQPMKGRSDEAIKKERDELTAILKEAFGDVNIIDTFFKDFKGSRLEFLGKSIMDGLAHADLAVFIGDWQKYDGCRCEQFIAAQYGVKCLYYNFWSDK